MSAAVTNARAFLAVEAAKEWIAAARHDSRCATVWVPSDRFPTMAEQVRKKPLPCSCWKAEALREIAEILQGTESEVAS